MSTATLPAKNGNGNLPAAQAPKQTIRQLLSSESMKNQFAMALPRHLTPERFIRVALTALTRTPKLEQCTQASLFGCLLTCSQLGLEPDGRRAHLIPYGTECTLVIDYKGLVELALRSGLVSNIHADKVCEQDDFDYDRGQVTRHKVDFKLADRGAAYAYYCIVRFKDGSEQAMVLSRAEVEQVRARSKAGRNGPWVTDFDEMAKKTVFKRLSKWITLSPEIRDAIQADDETERVTVEATARPALPLGSRSDQLAALLSAPREEQAEEPVVEQQAAAESAEHVTGDLSGLADALEAAQTDEACDAVLFDFNTGLSAELAKQLAEAVDARKAALRKPGGAK